MIGKLKGVIDGFGDDWVIVDVGGVGYVVNCSTKTLGSLPRVGEPVSLAIETYVREDQIRLFGFSSDVERDWFTLLLKVQGVGTKVALAILSTMAPNELTSAIALQDKALVSQAPGVGPKVAQRIVTELKDKVPAFATDGPGLTVIDGDGEALSTSAAGDAVSALANLGYGRPQAMGAISAALKQAGDEAETSELIKLGLKELAR